MRIASIDIGTNTCNLLIAEYSESNGLKFIYKEKEVITLINEQYRNDLIAEYSISNLIKVLEQYKKTTIDFNVDKIIATATSGIRSSSNKDDIVECIKKTIGIDVEVIDGHTEARYVYEGVKNAIELTEEYVLIIDIGGGSVEFIICNDEGIDSTFSFNIGAARLLRQENLSDPFKPEDTDKLNSLLNVHLHKLVEKSKSLKINTLIGSSGSFETFVDLINNEITIRKFDDIQTYNKLDINKFEIIYNKLITYDYSKRTEMPGMDIRRVKMIPVAAVITKFLINSLEIKNLIQSRYSIKEGLIFDYISRNFKN